MSTTREHKIVHREHDSERHREFMEALLSDLDAFERMLREGRFENGTTRIGAEQEMFIIDRSFQPARGVLAILERLDDPHFTTELGQFQIEANCDPQLLEGDGLGRLHAQLDDLVDRARHAARSIDMDVVLMGILPTMKKTDLGLDSMVPSPRYETLNRIITELRRGRFSLSIKGTDELTIDHDSVMLEACNSSYQLHMQVSPEDFPRMYNIAQVLAAPMMAISANSPIAFGKRLWAETRIALFQQAVDTRTRRNPLRETEARVSFGTRWVRSSIVDIYREDIARFRALVAGDIDEDAHAVLDRGEIPQLRALRLHNGTIYRWNRACFGVSEGVPHLRIENRIMPSGPSTIDQIANSALWFGLMADFGATDEDITKRIDFDQAGANFYTAAREGLGAHFEWLNGEETTARKLLLDHLLPRAESGLRRARVDEALIQRYLAVIDERVQTGRTGASWQFRSWNSLRDRSTPGERASALVAATVRRQLTLRPVARWERARLDEANVMQSTHGHRVEQIMRTDLFTVQPHDPAEILANLMIWERTSYIPVEDEDHVLLGLVSHRQVIRALAQRMPRPQRTVADIMLPADQVHVVAPDTTTVDAARKMRRFRIGCVAVVSEGRLVGLVTEEEFVGVTARLLGAPDDEDGDEDEVGKGKVDEHDESTDDTSS